MQKFIDEVDEARLYEAEQLLQALEEPAASCMYLLLLRTSHGHRRMRRSRYITPAEMLSSRAASLAIRCLQ
jgi:hypothetical protein